MKIVTIAFVAILAASSQVGTKGSKVPRQPNPKEPGAYVLGLLSGDIDGIPYLQWRVASRTILFKTAAARSLKDLAKVLGDPDQVSPTVGGRLYAWEISSEKNAPPYTIRWIRAVVLRGEEVGLGYYFCVPKSMAEPNCNFEALDLAWGHINGSPAAVRPKDLYYDRAEYGREEPLGPRQPWSVYGKTISRSGRDAYLVGYCPLTPVQPGIWKRNPNFSWSFMFAGCIFLGKQSERLPGHPGNDNQRDWQLIP